MADGSQPEIFFSIAPVTRCFDRFISPQGSRFSRSTSAGTFSTVYPSALFRVARSFQGIGAETVAPSRARVDQGAMEVAPRVLRSQSTKIFPARAALLASARVQPARLAQFEFPFQFSALELALRHLLDRPRQSPSGENQRERGHRSG